MWCMPCRRYRTSARRCRMRRLTGWWRKALRRWLRAARGVRRVVPCELRRWRKAPFAAATRMAWRAFKTDLQTQPYDAVIDLQGLSKSALVAWLARLAPGGQRYALANQTDGSSYERPTRWVADVAVRVQPHIHAVATFAHAVRSGAGLYGACCVELRLGSARRGAGSRPLRGPGPRHLARRQMLAPGSLAGAWAASSLQRGTRWGCRTAAPMSRPAVSAWRRRWVCRRRSGRGWTWAP